MSPIRTYCRSKRITLADFAKLVGRDLQTVKKWGTTRRIPPGAVPLIEKATKGELTGLMLRPDLWGADHDGEPQKEAA